MKFSLLTVRTYKEEHVGFSVKKKKNQYLYFKATPDSTRVLQHSKFLSINLSLKMVMIIATLYIFKNLWKNIYHTAHIASSHIIQLETLTECRAHISSYPRKIKARHNKGNYKNPVLVTRWWNRHIYFGGLCRSAYQVINIVTYFYLRISVVRNTIRGWLFTRGNLNIGIRVICKSEKKLAKSTKKEKGYINYSALT